MRATVGWGTASDVGRVRQSNQDAVLACEPIFAVADGMGGHAAGDVASALAVAELSTLADLDQVAQDDVATAIGRANARILAHAEAEAQAGMGTTLAGVVVVSQAGGDHWLVFNVGDSRVYRLASGQLSQITVDHSEVQELVADGRLDPDEARSHRRRSIVTRALGTNPAPEPDWWLLPVAPSERLLVCSDGLSNELDDAEIADTLARGPIGSAAQALVERALAAGGSDNVTAITIEIEVVDRGEGPDEDTLPRLTASTA